MFALTNPPYTLMARGPCVHLKPPALTEYNMIFTLRSSTRPLQTLQKATFTHSSLWLIEFTDTVALLPLNPTHLFIRCYFLFFDLDFFCTSLARFINLLL